MLPTCIELDGNWFPSGPHAIYESDSNQYWILYRLGELWILGYLTLAPFTLIKPLEPPRRRIRLVHLFGSYPPECAPPPPRPDWVDLSLVARFFIRPRESRCTSQRTGKIAYPERTRIHIFGTRTDCPSLTSDHRLAVQVLKFPIRLFLLHRRLQQPHTKVLDATINVHAEHQPKLPCVVHLAKHPQLSRELPQIWSSAMADANGVRVAAVAKCRPTKVSIAIDDYDIEHSRRCNGGEHGFQEFRCRIPPAGD
ncbi:hypothetical protein BJ322DRAFT_1058281 [Thelephora terrestris]|uniref:Uncharacterized protein n=1 Tax=Thelephora terrestris TaxID=56493 RepID=A0A9P6HG22_9AGAM|nr:hypothetical protein BJ322DRAFT_1058281 [Thelephora terrestris]